METLDSDLLGLLKHREELENTVLRKREELRTAENNVVFLSGKIEAAQQIIAFLKKQEKESTEVPVTVNPSPTELPPT